MIKCRSILKGTFTLSSQQPQQHQDYNNESYPQRRRRGDITTTTTTTMLTEKIIVVHHEDSSMTETTEGLTPVSSIADLSAFASSAGTPQQQQEDTVVISPPGTPSSTTSAAAAVAAAAAPTPLISNRSQQQQQQQSRRSSSSTKTTKPSTVVTYQRETHETSVLRPSVEQEGCIAIYNSLSIQERTILPDENMMLRHLRAEKGDVGRAIMKIKTTLQWRQDFDVDTIKTCFDDEDNNGAGGSTSTSNNNKKREEMRRILLRENDTGKIYIRGYDKTGRAIMYMRPARENTQEPLDNMRHLVYNLERAAACTKVKSSNQYEKINIIIDYHGFKLGDAPPLKVSKHTVDILQNHYPERMYRAYICDPPFVFRSFWAMIRPFLDPRTKDKIVFCYGAEGREVLAKAFDLTQVETCVGGSLVKPEFDCGAYLEKTPFCRTFGEKD